MCFICSSKKWNLSLELQNFPFLFLFSQLFWISRFVFHEFYSAFVINANIKYLQTESHAKSGQNTYNSIIWTTCSWSVCGAVETQWAQYFDLWKMNLYNLSSYHVQEILDELNSLKYVCMDDSVRGNVKEMFIHTYIYTDFTSVRPDMNHYHQRKNKKKTSPLNFIHFISLLNYFENQHFPAKSQTTVENYFKTCLIFIWMHRNIFHRKLTFICNWNERFTASVFDMCLRTTRKVTQKYFSNVSIVGWL